MSTHTPPLPTPVYRIVHVDCLATILARGALHAPNTTPADGLAYRTIHDANVQANRRVRQVQCGPGGTIHDYLPFYFGARSVMLLNLKSNRVAGYNEGQEPIVYLISSAQKIEASGAGFVFTDGHGLANFTQWFDSLTYLGAIDWPLLAGKYWNDTPQDNDRQRRKQAEFLVLSQLNWELVQKIVVYSDRMKIKVEAILSSFPQRQQLPVVVDNGLYY